MAIWASPSGTVKIAIAEKIRKIGFILELWKVSGV
jgi:hypothetical protein